MEVKVSVDGVPRVVCGVTEKTTCQEVVIALAQALGQPGRYTLREKFKDFERSMTPDERLLESLEKYDQQAKDVQLTLLHNGPSLWDGISRAKGGRYQPCPQMRKKDAGARVRRGSGSLSLHRRSLPPLSRLRQEAEQPSEDQKKPKRKSLTLMEEAWGWLESLGKGKFSSSCAKKTENILRETIMCQLARLQDLQLQIALVDEEIRELEGQQRARKAEQEAQQKIIEEETEQIQFWENELKAEEVYENDLQQQFLEMRQKAVECKAKLEEYRHRMQGLVFSGAQKVIQDSEMIPRKGSTNTATEISAVSTKDVNQRRSDSDSGVNIDRKFPPKEDSNLPHAPVAGSQIKERRPTGPTELREWWARWSEAQSPTSETKRRAMHRSELTVYLGSTKV
uniref:Ras association domain family member 11 n=1 Tax=Myripristis murdjan TaxID=586833 RepID=A0A668A414_9TELE